MKLFLSCDWGTSNFRLRLVDADIRRIIHEVTSDRGVANIHKAWLDSNLPEDERINFYRSVLHDAILKFSPGSFDKNVPIIISGMASSSIGLKELPYAKFPLDCRSTEQLNILKVDADREFTHPIFLISGCMTDRDIMRGEETILLGCDTPEKGEGVYIFPGTHSKHIKVNNGIASDFKTYVTGELFNLLIEKSILSNSISKGDDEESFIQGIDDAQNVNILNGIFSVRAKHILHQSSPVKNYQYLSGLIIGTELKELKNSTATLFIVSEDPLMKSYALGLSTVGVRGKVVYLRASEMLVIGHCRLAKLIS